MSIMYEALQKTQLEGHAQAIQSSQDKMTRDDWLDVGISLTIAFLLAAIIVAHYPQFNIKSENISIATSSSANNILPAAQAIQEVAVLKVPADTTGPIVQPKAALVESIDEADYKLKHTLNGVFVSDDEKVAMVNNRFFNIGDSIDGMKIVGIEPDKIKLESVSAKIELRIVV